MKTFKTIAIALCATAAMSTLTQCNNTPQTVPTTPDPIVRDTTPTLKIAYVDIDTLLINYALWNDLNEEMIRKEENVRTTLNEKAKELEADFAEFERKLNNNGFVTRERAESEQNRILKKRQDLEELQERLSNELTIENNKNNILFRDSINAYIKEYNKAKGYNIILSRLGDNILYIDGGMNITQEVIEGLNSRYKVTKSH